MQSYKNDRLSERSQEGWRVRKPRGPDLYKFAVVPLSAVGRNCVRGQVNQGEPSSTVQLRGEERWEVIPNPHGIPIHSVDSPLNRRKYICQGIIAIEEVAAEVMVVTLIVGITVEVAVVAIAVLVVVEIVSVAAGTIVNI